MRLSISTALQRWRQHAYHVCQGYESRYQVKIIRHSYSFSVSLDRSLMEKRVELDRHHLLSWATTQSTSSCHRNHSTTREISLNELENETDRLIELLETSPRSTDNTVTITHFQQAMKHWINQGNLEAATRAEGLLVALEQNYNRILDFPESKDMGFKTLQPTTICYNLACNAYANCNGGVKAAECAERILDRMLDGCYGYPHDITPHKKGKPNLLLSPPEPLTSTFNTVMNAWAKSKCLDSGRQAELVFVKMERWLYDCTHNNVHPTYRGAYPDIRSLNTVLNAWANCAAQRHDALDRVFTILNYTIQQRKPGHTNISGNGDHVDAFRYLQLDRSLFHSVLHAVAESTAGGVKNAEMAQGIFSLLEDLDMSFNSTGMNMGQKSPNMYGSDDDIEEGFKPNTKTWSLLLQCWTNAVLSEGKDGGSYAAEQALNVFSTMMTLFEKGEDVKPNMYTMSSLIMALSRCRSEKSVDTVVDILERMEHLFKVTQDESFRVNTTVYNTCLTAMSKREGSLNKGLDLLNRMESNNTADTTSYNILMDGYGKSSNRNSNENVQMLFERMSRLKLQPDAISYHILMQTIAGSKDMNAVERVNRLLDEMIEVYMNDKSKINLSTTSFTIALNACAKSVREEKAEPARKIFHKLISLHEKTKDESIMPCVMVFGAFFSACSNQHGSDDRKLFALRLALKTYNLLLDSPIYGNPNAFIYGPLIKSCGRIVKDVNERGALIERLFQDCIKRGEVSQQVLRIFQKSCPRRFQSRILSDCVIESNDSIAVPVTWCSNVNDRDRPRRIEKRDS